MDVEVCTKCNKEVRKEQRGSLTQWIFDGSTCSCRKSVLIPVSDDKANKICPKCFNQKVSRRSGSITQWMFRQYQCKCGPETDNTTSENIVNTLVSNNSTGEPDEEESFDTSTLPFPHERYKPLRYVARNAASVVYKCFDRRLVRTVAIKTLLFANSDQLVRFQQEARATALLKHLNIIEVLDFGVNNGSAYMVMEFVDAVDLEDWIQANGALTEPAAMEMMTGVCRALDYAHSKGIYHRDLKPQNILISKQNREPKLIDFGLALVINPNQDITKTQGLSLSGTPSYMSPDQFSGRSYDARSEIYSLGCVLFACLTGRPPFHGDTALAIARKHSEVPAPPLREANPDRDYSENVEQVIRRCLEKNPSDRYSSILELANDLQIDITGTNQESTLTSEQVAAAGMAQNSGVVTSSVTAQHVERGTAAKKSKSQIWVASLILLVVLSVTVALIMYRNQATKVTAIAPSTEVAPVAHKDEQKRPITQAKAVGFDRSVLTEFKVDKVFDDVGTARTLEMMKQKMGNYTDTTITAKQIDLLAKAPPTFYYLRLKNCEGVTADNIIRLKPLKLLNLRVSFTDLDNDGFAAIATLPHLKMLQLEGNRNHDNKGFIALKKSQTLNAIEFKRTKLDAEAFKIFSEMNLELISLDNIPNFDERWFLPLSVTKIFDARLLNMNVGDSCLQYVLKLPKLQNIVIRNTAITDKGVEELSHYTKLILIDLENNKGITDAAVPSLVDLYEHSYYPNSLDINLSNTSITVKSIPLLKQLKTIHRLDLRQLAGVNKQVLAGLRKALPKTEIVSD